MTFLENSLRMMAKILPLSFFDLGFRMLAPIKTLERWMEGVETIRFRKRGEPKRILVISDIHLGDAILIQSFISALKQAFPNLELTYFYQAKAAPIIRGNPHVDRHLAYFGSSGRPSLSECQKLKDISETSDFNLILNFCHALPSSIFKFSRALVVQPIQIIGNVMRAYYLNNQKAHVLFHLDRYAHELAQKMSSPGGFRFKPGTNFTGGEIYLTQRASREAQDIQARWKLNPESRKIMINPDSSSPLTFIPFNFQSALLRGVLSVQNSTVLMCCGYNFPKIEEELIKEIPSNLKDKIVVVPKDVPLDVQAAMMDGCDMFITGDTGPLHMAAAHKTILDSDNEFRNRTAVVGLFGATSAKVYGYDSFIKNYLPASQAARSKSFEGRPSCKNLICMDDKSFLNCRKGRCFEGLSTARVIEYVRDYFSS